MDLDPAMGGVAKHRADNIEQPSEGRAEGMWDRAARATPVSGRLLQPQIDQRSDEFQVASNHAHARTVAEAATLILMAER
jgi:hypothetical protein